MYKVLSILLFLFIIPGTVKAQILPKEGSRLCYRLIGFSFPTADSCGKYKLEIAAGKFDNETAFLNGIIKSIECKTNKIIVEVPAFGSEYTWHIVYTDNHSMKIISALHHFSTLTSPNVDTANTRLRIISNTGKNKNAYVFLDCIQALYDMNGNPVWFYSDPKATANGNSNIRDIKLTNDGTLTFIIADRASEVNYNGEILWQSPNNGAVSGDNSEHIHHELTKLGNGHYMVLGTETVSWKLPYFLDDSSYKTTDATILQDSDNTFSQKLQLGTLIEYDKQGNVVWSWKSSGYFKQSDLYSHYLPNGKFEFTDVHENAFFFNEQAKVIYIGFRDISRILKVKYPEGTVLAAYGNKYKPGMAELGNDLFCGQHSIRESSGGDLYVYNNNSLTATGLPKLELLKQPANVKDGLKKIWEYSCALDGINGKEVDSYNKKMVRLQNARDKNKLAKMRKTSGGNLIEMPDGSLFASMSTPFSKIFMLNKEKKITWCAVIERKQSSDTTWSALPTYRASIIANNKDLEKLVWNTELTTK